MSDQLHAALPVQPVAVNPVNGWVEQINEAYRCSLGWAVSIGQLLSDAKKQLGHGLWVSMWQTGKMTFGLRTAEMLMEIARHPVLGNAKYLSNLPHAWSVLYVLSKLPAEIVEQGIISGAIKPELSLKEAQRMLSSYRAGVSGASLGPEPKPFDVGRQKARVLRSLKLQAIRWPTEHRAELAQLLETVAAKLRNGGNGL